jgi:hypothetical protein
MGNGPIIVGGEGQKIQDTPHGTIARGFFNIILRPSIILIPIKRHNLRRRYVTGISRRDYCPTFSLR